MAKASSNEWSSALSGGADTIVARSTAAGPAALAVIRLSGRETGRLAGRLCGEIDFDRVWTAQLVTLAGDDGGPPESAVAIPYRAPRSYTGEDMLELMVHGSPYVVDTVVERLVAAGARPAEPGEFTRRAVANGKMDLVQAEAVRDLVAAETAWQARNARQQMAGALSTRFERLRSELVALLARLEAGLDFAAQQIEPDSEDLARRLAGCRAEVAALLATATAGVRIRDGVRVVIWGAPNSGKSTLFNYLIGIERAIVAPGPGTTRDALEAELEIGGVRVTLVDTAGIRATDDPVELEGIRRTQAALAEAGVIVVLWPVDDADPPQRDREHAGVGLVRVRSKADLAGPGWSPDPEWLAVSCVNGDGLDWLRAAIERAVTTGVPDLGGEVAISRRHRQALERAADELERCELESPELAAESVRWAVDVMTHLVGDIVTEDVLDEVFASFCIGK
jgi:tRNA modification GTPase